MRALRHIIPAAAVIAAGAALWSAGTLQQQKLAARHEFLTMQFGPPVNAYDALQAATRFLPDVGPMARWRADIRTERAEARYWLAEYEALAVDGDGESAAEGRDATLLMLAANAAYRQAAARLTDAGSPEHLERIAAMYRDVLEADPGFVDAAYNYEFVLRMRDRLATQRAAARRRAAARPEAGPPPASVHGVPGTAPKDPDMSDFKIIVPQGPDERQQQPDAGRGGAKPRKG